MQTLEQKMKAVDAALLRWQTRLIKASNMVTKLTKKKRRLEAQRDKPRQTTKPPEKPVPVISTSDPDLVEKVSVVLEANRKKEDDLTIPKLLRRDPNADALKAMNKRIEERVASRSKKSAKIKAPSRLIAKAMAERDAINQAAKK